MTENELDDTELRHIFRQIDTNSDDTITKDEMMVFIQGLMENNANFRFYTISEL